MASTFYPRKVVENIVRKELQKDKQQPTHADYSGGDNTNSVKLKSSVPKAVVDLGVSYAQEFLSILTAEAVNIITARKNESGKRKKSKSCSKQEKDNKVGHELET